MAFNDFTLLLCPINTGGHWEIAFAFPQTKKIIYINPLGERHSNIVKFIRGWRSLVYKRSMEGLDYGKGHQKWTISSVQHTLQNDSVNCGIFVMKV
jgi:Ulp1 family protease